uniref:Uncharacterized protein n=1 Tax=Arundo donax TaxID=35708 RepID=A0A0A9HFX6_ARUDO
MIFRSSDSQCVSLWMHSSLES